MTGIDDTHIHAGADGVVEEYRVDRLAHRIVAPEGKGHVGDAARDQGAGQFCLDVAGRLDKLHGVVVVFIDARGNRENIGIEDNVVGVEIQLTHQQVVTAFADFLAPLQVVGLAVLVKRHDHDGGTIALAQPGLGEKLFLTGFEADRIHHGLALDAFQSGLDDLPFGGVDHDGHPGNIRFGRYQVEEGHHGGFGVQHALVHVDVDDLGAVRHLDARHFERGLVIAFQHQSFEPGRAGHVTALTDIHEQAVGGDVERFQSAQPAGGTRCRQYARRYVAHRVGDGLDMGRGGPAAAPGKIEEPAAGKTAEVLVHDGRRLIELAEGIGQARVQVGAEIAVGNIGQFLDERANLLEPPAAIGAHDQWPGVGNGIPEGLGVLPGKHATADIGKGH